MTRTIIQNVKIVNEIMVLEPDVLIENNKIIRIRPGIKAKTDDTVIDATGKHLLRKYYKHALYLWLDTV